MRLRLRVQAGQDAGQALIIVALAVAILLGSLALGIDWGYGLTQRRVMQNGADAGTVAAGNMLAQSVIAVKQGSTTTYVFGASQEQIFCTANSFAQANNSFAPAGGTRTTRVEYGIVANPNNPATWDPPTWTASSVTSCTTSTTTLVNANTRFVRVRSSVQYHAFFAGVIGNPTVQCVAGATPTPGTCAAASAAARLTGTPTPASGPTWPMVRHYDPADFSGSTGCGSPCDPAKAAPKTFWSQSDNGAVYGNFKAAVDLSRYSTYYPYSTGSPSNVGQLLTNWDQTGNHPDHAFGSCAAAWNASGNHDPSNNDKPCDVPNWFYYTFGGTLSLSQPWDTAGTPRPTGQSAVVALGTRGVCTSVPAYLSTPSCGAGNDKLGDRVEATSGNLGNNISQALSDRIRDFGKLNAFSSHPYPNTNGTCTNPGLPSENNCLGKAVTVLIYLWDCAEDYNGGNWVRVAKNSSSTDCSDLDNSGNKKMGTNSSGDVNRVHLFTIAPFTFYNALVNTSSIQGYWGGAAGDPASCPACVLNPLSNAAYLVGD